MKTTKGHFYIQFDGESAEDVLDAYVGSKGHKNVNDAITEAERDAENSNYVILNDKLQPVYTKETK